jgi:RNA polymerase sigma factor (sigma-70 family)
VTGSPWGYCAVTASRRPWAAVTFLSRLSHLSHLSQRMCLNSTGLGSVWSPGRRRGQEQGALRVNTGGSALPDRGATAAREHSLEHRPASTERPAVEPSPSELDGSVDLERDRRLVERCQNGESHAFEELYRRYHRRLTFFCLRRLGEPHEAEDAAQEAFSRAWRALPSFGGSKRFYPWLSVIAANVCTDIHRRRSSIVSMGEVPEPRGMTTGPEEAEERLLSGIDGAMAAQALRRLSPRYQRVLSLREGSGWSSRNIADHEGTTVPAVETLLWRARQALKKEFEAIAGTADRLGLLILASASVLRRGLLRTLQRVHHHHAPARIVGRLLDASPTAWQDQWTPTVATVGGAVVTVGGVVAAATLALGSMGHGGHTSPSPTSGASTADRTSASASPSGAGTSSGGRSGEDQSAVGRVGATGGSDNAASTTKRATSATAAVDSQPSSSTRHTTGGASASTSGTSPAKGAPGTTTTTGSVSDPTGGGGTTTSQGGGGGLVGALGGGGGSLGGSTVGSVGSTVGSTVGSVGSTVGSSVGGSVGSTVGSVGGSVGSTVGSVGSTVGSVGSTVGSVVGGTTGSLGSTIGSL